ncbi:chemotaxis protein CheB [Nocardia mexicana]|uniref:protein-glutamate methylesterase n=1 Tax=Nocardia mexicana TaxID=279262 RepID=A0A370H7B2_9NOCA|nr:chemotaxis protein CheB [Nocardia mexicana]RDI50031.1 two-component system chemotaxis response regulator CheB [Nocardia mexicana]
MTESPSHVVVVGASAGGITALRDLVAGLPLELPAAVLVVLHLPPGGTSVLASILGRAGPLPVSVAADGMPLEAGTIYTAVPDRHLLVDDGRIRLSRGPTENRHRPGVDVLFRSAAIEWGQRAAGVVLSGALDDGTTGLALIKARGGLAVVQDPDEADYRSMPESASAATPVDHVLPAGKIGLALHAEMRNPAPVSPSPVSDSDRLEARIDAGEQRGPEEVPNMMPPSGLACPDCGGALFTADSGRYRCRVGHVWTGRALLEEQDLEIQRSLWTAYRALEEKQQLAERMRAHAGRSGQPRVAQRYAKLGEEQGRAAEVLRRLLFDPEGFPKDDDRLPEG